MQRLNCAIVVTVLNLRQSTPVINIYFASKWTDGLMIIIIIIIITKYKHISIWIIVYDIIVFVTSVFSQSNIIKVFMVAHLLGNHK